MRRRRMLKLLGGVGSAALLGACTSGGGQRPQVAATAVPPPSAPPLPPMQSLPVGVYGADSSYSKVTDALIDSAQRELRGTRPIFWGRYFNHSDDRGSRQEISFDFSQEAAPMARRGVHVLPIFAQNNSHASRNDGRGDGYRNAHDFIAAIGLPRLIDHGSRYIVMLNVEKGAGFQSNYFVGWAEGLARGAVDHGNNRLAFLPSVYLHLNEAEEMGEALRRATALGTPYYGSWVALVDPDAVGGPAGCGPQGAWLVEGAERALPGRVLLNQYRIDCRLDAGEVDFSSVNPKLDPFRDLLDYLYRPKFENRGRA